jgi:hypothetical protein
MVNKKAADTQGAMHPRRASADSAASGASLRKILRFSNSTGSAKLDIEVDFTILKHRDPAA